MLYTKESFEEFGVCQLTYGMEVTKRYPLASMHQGPGDFLCYNSLTRTSHSLFDWVNRLRLNKNSDTRSQFYFLERAYSSVVPIRKVLGAPEEPIVYCCPTEMSRYSTWTSNLEHPKLSPTFQALPDPSKAAENKPSGFRSTTLVREITQKLLNICHLQHFCDLVCDLVHTFSASGNPNMTSKNTLHVSEMIERDNLKKSAAVKLENLTSRISGHVTTFDVGYCNKTYQGDSKESMIIMNNTALDVNKATVTGNIEKCSEVKSENLVPILSENIIQMEVEHCNISCQTDDKESIAMMNVQYHSNSHAMGVQSEMKRKVKNVDKEMVSRKQRRINKHSKKRKRRMRKKEKISLACSHEKGGTDIKKEVVSNASSQSKLENRLPGPTGSRTVFHDWEESDEDLCIVFEDEVDSVCKTVPENNVHSARIKESCDLWIEFDSLTIVSGNSDTSVECRSYSSEISVECDSDSEYETDSGQIFVGTDDFDSCSGLVFLNSDADFGLCSGLAQQSYVHCPSFVSRTTSYELVNDCAGMYEINKRWRESTSDVDGKPRLPQRVTFAPEDELVSVFPVDIMDRKSEWEQFALERFRFKRRIDEFEKIIEPYLTSAHREKIFRRLLGGAAS